MDLLLVEAACQYEGTILMSDESEAGKDKEGIETGRSMQGQPSKKSAGEVKKSCSTPLTGKPAGGRPKPFSMSYGGMTQAEYTQYLRDRGSR